METEIFIGNGVQGEQIVTNFISEEAVFPLLQPSCYIQNLQRGDRILRVWCEQSMVYTNNGRNDIWNLVVELVEQVQTQIIPVPIPDVRGGQISIKCFVTIKDSSNRNRTISSEFILFNILAKQPIKKNVRTKLNSSYLEAVIYKRSAFEQFNNQGEPIFNNGVGLYRIITPSVAEIWDWKSNADAAITDFENRKKTVSQIPAKYRTDDPDLYKNLPDFTPKQVELEALQSYGAGTYYIPKRSGLSRNWKWISGGVNDGFADSCLALLKEVVAGNSPLGWD